MERETIYINLFPGVLADKEVLLYLSVFTSVSEPTYSNHYFQDRSLYDLYLQIIHPRFNLFKVKFSDAWIQKNLFSQQRKYRDGAEAPLPSLIAPHNLYNCTT